ncbi:MAG: hypothetical protein A3G05_00725 [Candidatus Zambryskibacteria bacterium RIFCSPLOWO2_12_FULL_45_14]|uniref:Transcobalamin-like C-terminal domain-containing protein n=2 Tax=Candidatus Zambryskiibacteriota TaxID=1817925 RepID=A0A1G2UMV4_9BACT|nr:MAG: hypothetical protein A3H60_01290 [Candidatus Zambryskibacteria bacterium RIFCSPLOWO2_02_FULL_44_12b]OHB14483.1 MAG: hypothetical protein A3G05_00725 [Candidatus Zambryskibacteria bacterium RIFCSPLOWO2_12_FULL_45_14]
MKYYRIGLLVLVALGLFIYTNRTIPIEKNINQEVVQAGATSLTIENLYTGKTVLISENETVLEMLEKLDLEDPQVRLSTKEYSGLGVLVESINGKKNGTDSKYWQYKVNDIMPQIGADKYKLKNGDRVEWYFDQSLF